MPVANGIGSELLSHFWYLSVVGIVHFSATFNAFSLPLRYGKYSDDDVKCPALGF